ncbi:MAG TPA: cofactor-independent phosphoglycerate mutase [Nitrospirae bacterium]|nr:cofactor-independent phosphoglycerate mutase [Nitrospirota bacterium]
MKYIVIIGDGMTDRPLKELDGKTPLQAAFTPNMDRLARTGILGMARTIPRGFSPGSDVANLSIMGYDPGAYYSGRAPLEAASMGVELDGDDVAYRCNLVTLKYNRTRDRAVMEDYSAGHITSEEADELIRAVASELGSDEISFYPGISYRHLMVWKGGEYEVECIPPHDIIGKEITEYLPCGKGEDVLRDLMNASVSVLEHHPVNKKRASEGKPAANSIWLWGQGKKLDIPTFEEKYHLSGALVSAVDLTKGLGVYAGLEILRVPGVTGYLDTNYSGKAEYSLKALERHDFVYIHVEAPDEAGHSGNYRDKIKAIEDIDALVVGSIIRGVKSFESYRILLMPDHPTPIEIRTHSDDPVPFVIYDSGDQRDNGDATFDESIAEREGIVFIDEGHRLMDFFIRSKTDL